LPLKSAKKLSDDGSYPTLARGAALFDFWLRADI